MRLVPLIVLAAVTTPALADPEPDTCEVRVVRAPDQVRAAIEARIGIEAACTTLDVRVVQTRDGYYVIASPPRGEVFEGTVPDAGLVGELVTSWARLPPSSPPDAPATTEVAEPPPSSAPALALEARASVAPRARGGRELAIGMLMTTNGYGVRGEVDVLASAGFSLGIALGLTSSDWAYGDSAVEMAGFPPRPSADVSFRDLRALAVAAKTFTRGPWRLRVQAGLGVLQTEYTGTMTRFVGAPVAVEGEGVTTTFEAAVSASRDLGSSWALSIGPLLTYYGQRYQLDDGIEPMRPTREYDIGGHLAIRRRL